MDKEIDRVREEIAEQFHIQMCDFWECGNTWGRLSSGQKEEEYGCADKILSLKIDGTTLKELLEKLDETGGTLAIVRCKTEINVYLDGEKEPMDMTYIIWQGGQE